MLYRYEINKPVMINGKRILKTVINKMFSDLTCNENPVGYLDDIMYTKPYQGYKLWEYNRWVKTWELICCGFE